MRFLVDMPLSPVLAVWLRERGHDAVHASALGLSDAPDAKIMERAKRDGRTIVTADLDYARLLALEGSGDVSLILFRDGDWSDDAIIARLASVLETLTAEDIAESIIVVDRARVRRRRLPIVE